MLIFGAHMLSTRETEAEKDVLCVITVLLILERNYFCCVSASMMVEVWPYLEI